MNKIGNFGSEGDILDNLSSGTHSCRRVNLSITYIYLLIQRLIRFYLPLRIKMKESLY